MTATEREQIALDGLLGESPQIVEKKVPVIAHERTIRPRVSQNVVDPVALALHEEAKNGLAKRDAGVKKVMARLTAEERASIQIIIKVVASEPPTVFIDGEPVGFTSEDVEAKLPLGIREKLDAFPGARGGAMLGAARADLIYNTMRVVKAKHGDARGRNIAVWARVVKP